MLVLHAFESQAPVFAQTDSGLSKVLLAGGVPLQNQFFDSLDLRRNPDPAYRRALLEQLQLNYSHRRFNLIRKQTLVNYGFRLPSALDNRPLQFGEFEQRVNHAIYVSATPGTYEIRQSQGHIVEHIIRPTGLIDPALTVRPVSGQVDDLLGEIRKRAEKRERVLVTTLTKKMAESI